MNVFARTFVLCMCGQAESYVERLEQEILELKRQDAELRQMLDTQDNIHFLQVRCLLLWSE